MASAAPALDAEDLASGKGYRDENFPVASILVRADARAPIMAFYRFSRAADDVADHPTADAATKHRGLAAMRAGLSGTGGNAEALSLHRVMTERGIDPIHAHDLLDAFDQDVDQRRYASAEDLMAYCRKSAMPVGRYVLDVHGEDRATWPANDALCAALQIINHLQDCAKDFRELDRVYLPTETLAKHGANVDDLAADRASPALLATIRDLAAFTRTLLAQSADFARTIRDRRLAAEVAIIHRLALDLVRRLETRDPLGERVHHTKVEAALIAARAALPVLLGVRR